MYFKNDVMFGKDVENDTTITKEQIRYIHILLNNLDITDDEYREILCDEFGVDTCKDLGKEQASELIHKLNYKYDTSYRLGYNKAIEKYLDNVNLEILFQEKFRPTNLELKMFRMLDIDKQKDILDL